MSINKEQSAAIKHTNGPLMIVAGAGTGKTTVLVEKIKKLIKQNLAKPEEILAVTFTQKATQELLERIDISLPLGLSNVRVETFHSLADSILRDYAIHIGLNPNFKLLSDTQSTYFLKKHLFDLNLNYFLPLGNPNKFIEAMLNHFSLLQDQAIEPEEYLSWVKNQKPKNEEDILEIEMLTELSNTYAYYQNLKNRNGYMDYGDLLQNLLKLLKKRPNIRKKLQDEIKYILVDEFQDTNIVQNEILLSLINKNKNITVVGDDDQAIYSFRGATIKNILNFKNEFPEAKTVVLTKNYRSTQSILDAAYKLIRNNDPNRLEVTQKINKRLTSAQEKKGAKPIFIHENTETDEAQAVSGKILKLTKSGYNFKDVALLVRANSHARVFEKAFDKNDIPYQVLSKDKLFLEEEVLLAQSYLSLIEDIEDNLALYTILSAPVFKIDQRDILILNSEAKKTHESLFLLCEQINEKKVSDETKQKIGNFIKQIVKHKEQLSQITLTTLIFEFFKHIGVVDNIIESQSEEKAQVINRFLEKVSELEKREENVTIQDLIDWIELNKKEPDNTRDLIDWKDENKVKILTVHASKGLEFPVVFLVNLVSQRFPSVNKKAQLPIPNGLSKEDVADEYINQERRLFYVGMTRAKEQLFLTAADFYSEGIRKKTLSPFIAESLEEIIETRSDKTEVDTKTKKKNISSQDIQKHTVNELSYSQIQAFKTCPLHYKLQYIIKLPTKPTSALSIGTSVHEALYLFYKDQKNGLTPTKTDLENYLKTSWSKQGFESKSHSQKSLESASTYLNKYLESQKDKQESIMFLEKDFRIKLAKGDEELVLKGKIDKIINTGDNTLEVIDYKTGTNIPTQKEVADNMQLSIYALALIKDTNLKITNPEKIKLSLCYLEEGKKITTTKTLEDLVLLENELFEIKKEIENSDFKCTNGYFCQNCEYIDFCSKQKS